MNEGIELHDSELATVSFCDGVVTVSLSRAYVHRSSGVPGSDAGTGWSQAATLTFPGASPVSLATELPVWISDGSLRMGGALHENLIPARGNSEGVVEFCVTLSSGEKFVVRGQSVSIQLHGEPAYIEEFNARLLKTNEQGGLGRGRWVNTEA